MSSSSFEKATEPVDEKTPVGDVSRSQTDVEDNEVLDVKNNDKVSEEPSIEYPSGITLVLIMLATLLVLFLGALDQTIVATAIPQITAEFQGLEKVSWYGSAYFMTFGGFLPSWGKAYNFFNIKYAFLTTTFIFAIGSLICGVAPNANTLIAGRAIAGVGAAGMSTGCFLITTLIAEPRKRPLLMSMIITVYGLAAVCGPLIGGAFTEKVTWRWCFYINLPVSGVAGVITLFVLNVPSQPQPATLREKLRHLDPIGALLLTSAIIAYILAFQYGGQTMTWNSSTVIGLIVGFVLIFVAFFAWEAWQGEWAMIILRLLKDRTVWVSSLTQVFFASSYFVALYYLPIYFQSIDGVSPAQSGVRNLPLVIAIGLSSMCTGPLIARTGHVMPVAAAGAALAAVACGLFYTLDESTTMGQWIGFQILGGAAWAGAWQCGLQRAQVGKDMADLPVITSIILFSQTIGGAFGIAAAQSAFDNTLINTLPMNAPGVSVSSVLATGVTDLRTVFDAEQVAGILLSYLAGLRVVWAFTVACSGIAFFLCFLNDWKRLYQDGDSNDAAMAAAV